MKISKLSSEDNILKILIEDTNPEFVNSLRRAIVSEVPVLAIEDVYFLKNKSALYDEMLALRLGLIPLKTDLKSYNLQEECSCKGKGCAKCQVKLSLNVVGPCNVYAKDIVSSDPSVIPIYPDMIIIKLLKDQEISLDAVAVLGRGANHAKWCAGLAYYQEVPEINISSGISPKDSQICIKHCPRNVFELKDKKLVVKNNLACNLCKSCQDRTNNAVAITGDKSKYIFILESWGQLSPKEILSKATELVTKKLKEVKLK